MDAAGIDTLKPTRAKIEPHIRDEFPELVLSYIRVRIEHGSSRHMAKRLKLLADRIGGAQAVTLREQPTPHAYRTFFRHIGLDPDVTRTPIEEVVVRRLVTGGFRRSWPASDALTLAVADTGVAIWAYDGDAVRGDLVLRQAVEGERVGASTVSAGTILISDEIEPLSVLFGSASAEAEAKPDSASAVACGLKVAGVSQLEVDEALSIFHEALAR